MAKKLLIVDSDMRTSGAFDRLFSRLGYNVEVAGDHLQAQKKIQNSAYSCIIVNYGPSCNDATELLTFTKKQLPSTIAVVLTDYPSLENTIATIACGADIAFSKPVNTELLIKAVEGNITGVARQTSPFCDNSLNH
jgi:DNA-binding NtrC family response regulator